MKVFIGLVFGAIAIGLLLIAAVVAFVWPISTDAEALPIDDIGLVEIGAYSRDDVLGIQLRWVTARQETTTFVLERSLSGEDGSWQRIVTVEPGSRHYVDENTVEYLDEDVEHLVTYFYRIQMTEPDGGGGMSHTVDVTAVEPSR